MLRLAAEKIFESEIVIDNLREKDCRTIELIKECL